MSREIQFRAWDKINRRMLINVMPNLSGGLTWMTPCGESFDSAVKNFEIMQFTGLQDKNWRKVYEGDIISRFDGGHISTIRFHQGQFVADIKGEGGWVPSFFECREGEVVGNIYENPELVVCETQPPRLGGTV